MSCSTGATDTSGAQYGAFGITGNKYRVVSAYVQTDNLAPYRTYGVSHIRLVEGHRPFQGLPLLVGLSILAQALPGRRAR